MARDLGIALSRFAINKPAQRGIIEVVDILEKTLQDFPDDLEVWEKKGTALFLQKRYSEALAAFETVLAKKPENEMALARAASLAQNLDDAKVSLEYWKKAVAMNPWMPDYQANLTNLLVQHGAWHEVAPAHRHRPRLIPRTQKHR